MGTSILALLRYSCVFLVRKSRSQASAFGAGINSATRSSRYVWRIMTVASAQIRPNREVPTGEVVFETTSGDREEFNVAGCEGSRDGAAQGGGSVHDHRRHARIAIL
ncbi:MAG: hypothetical protein ACLR8P_05485 [Clostridium fessum]